MKIASTLALLVSLVGLSSLKAEVVIGNTGYTDGSGNNWYQGTATPPATGQGIGFNVTTGSSAGTGKWALSSLAFQMATSDSTFTISSINLSLYRNNAGILTLLNNSNVNWTTTGTSNIIGTTAKTFTLDLNGFYGSTNGSDQNTGLANGSSYLLAWDVIGTTSATQVWTQDTNNYTGPWTATGSYNGWNQGTNFNGQNISTLGDSYGNMGYVLDVAAVPEPGTLILGSIAALGGAGGWWARRRKKVAAAEETSAI